MATSFETLRLRPELLTGVARSGFTEMTDIQSAALPVALRGADIVAHARTGSGKTAIFGLTLLQKLDISRRTPQAIVLCPTRELAAQLVASIRALAVGLDGVRVVLVTGGNSSRDQRDALRAGAHVVVGTPGRVLHQLELGRIKTPALQTVVLDEADRMLDMGFEDEVLGILNYVPTDHQTLLFSATWPHEMKALSRRVQRSPEMVGTAALLDDAVLKQSVVLCRKGERDLALRRLLGARVPVPTLVFCETRIQCKRVAGLLRGLGVAALALHGEMEQRDREEVTVCFRNGSARVLVATNVAARGLDVEGIELVISYELASDAEVHVHRVGRTARASTTGEAISLVIDGSKEMSRLTAIEAYLGTELERAKLAGEPSETLADWSADWSTLVLLGGRRDKLRPGDLLGALTRGVGLDGTDVGMIVITDKRAWVAVRSGVARRAADGLNQGRIKKKRYRVHLVGGQRKVTKHSS